MYQNNVATLPHFSGRERVVGPWFPDVALEDPDQAAWFLIGRSTSHQAAWVIALRVSPFRIGRGHDMDLSIPYPTVSRVHAELIVSGRRLQIHDLSSRNGTFVDGRRIRGSVIVESDVLLQFANVPFRVCLLSEAEMDRRIVPDGLKPSAA